MIMFDVRKGKFIVLLIGVCTLFSFPAFSETKSEKRYRVELIIFRTTSNPGTDETEYGKPNLKDALPYAPIESNKLVLTDAKRKLAKRHPTLIHTAWLQTAGTKDSPTKVHLQGGAELSNGTHEVDGIVEIYPGKQFLITTDLAIYHPDKEQSSPAQIARFQTTNPVIFDEINYIQQSPYGMILMVTPEVTRRI